MAQIREMIELPLRHSTFKTLGVKPPRGTSAPSLPPSLPSSFSFTHNKAALALAVLLSISLT